jgi:hypothetical protein
MSYLEAVRNCLSEFVIEGISNTKEDIRYDALRMLNLLHTHPDITSSMQEIYTQGNAISDCERLLFDPANTPLFDTGFTATFPKGTEFLHFATSSSFNNVASSAAILATDFSKCFPKYIQSRSSAGRTLWIARNCKTATNLEGICKAAMELGLYHFGQLTRDVPIVAFHLKTLREVVVLKPTWAHAFANWYFDPAPEGATFNPAHGRARCLETGELKREEWVVRPSQMIDAFEVIETYLSHEVDEKKPLQDFHSLGVNYWEAVERRVKLLQKV